MPDLKILENGILLEEIEEGIDYLTNIVIDNFLNLSLSDLYAPEFGTELTTLPSRNVTSVSEMRMKLLLMVDYVKTKIRREQEATPGPLAEMLDDIFVLDVSEDTDEDQKRKRWKLLLQVKSLTGQINEISQTIQ